MAYALDKFISLCPQEQVKGTDGLPAEINRKKVERGRTGTGGRNNLGRITIRRRGGGHKRKFLIVDYNGQIGQHAEWTIHALRYTPHSSSHKLALCVAGADLGGAPRVKLVPFIANMQIGSAVKFVQLGELRVGEICSNVEFLPRRLSTCRPCLTTYREPATCNAAYAARAAGSFCKIVSKKDGADGPQVLVLLPSKKVIELSPLCSVMPGRVGNSAHRINYFIGKAGRNR